MKPKQTLTILQEIVNIPKPDFQDSKIPLSKLAIQSRQRRIHQLKVQEYSDQEISEKTGFSLSTIEKDLHVIREKTREWYEEEAIKDYCESLQDSIIICDVAINNLQILYDECDDVDSKIKILNSISNFEERIVGETEKE